MNFKAVKIKGYKINLNDKVNRIIIDPDTGRIPGFLGKSGIFFSKNEISKISAQEKEVFIIDKAKALKNKKESKEEEFLKSKIKEIISSKVYILKEKVETESGNYLGIVRDFAFDDVSWRIKNISVADKVLMKFFTRELVIPDEDILFIDKDKIIVRDGFVKKEAKAQSQVKAEFAGVSNGITMRTK